MKNLFLISIICLLSLTVKSQCLETWNWNHFYKYLAWGGLQNTEDFQNEIANDPISHNLYKFYSASADVNSSNPANQFSTTCQ